VRRFTEEDRTNADLRSRHRNEDRRTVAAIGGPLHNSEHIEYRDLSIVCIMFAGAKRGITVSCE